MPDPWPGLARQHGRKSVMSLTIDDATLDAETARQAKIIFPMLKPHLDGGEVMALDYGCGAGRFTRAVSGLVNGGTVGYDPCTALIEEARRLVPDNYIIWRDSPAPDELFNYYDGHFDVVFTAMVLCLPDVDVEATAAGLVRVMTADATLIVLDHMPDFHPGGTWVRMRPFSFYSELFLKFGVNLRQIGSIMQLDKPVAVTVGRRI